MSNFNMDELVKGMEVELNGAIQELEGKVRLYGSFNVIANSFARTEIQRIGSNAGKEPEPSPVVTEYLALMCLKFPYSLGYAEFSRVREIPKDLYEIEELAKKIMSLYSFLHNSKFKRKDEVGDFFDMNYFAQAISSEELLVRNDSFEEHHWDLLEGLYRPYDDFARAKFGFTIDEAIRLCLTIADLLSDRMKAIHTEIVTSSTQKYAEIMDYKHRGRAPKEFYPPEFLARYKKMKDKDIEWEFQASIMTYEMVMIGRKLSFTAKDLADMEDIDITIIGKFLDKLSIAFGDINPDFSQPEIMHPLKDRPLIKHEQRHLCPSLSLLDYSLDRIFADLLIKDPKKKGKFETSRHDYLVEKGMEYLSGVLRPTLLYTNLVYDGGEMDGFMEVDGNVFFVEGKGHRISDKAKRGYINRLETHVDDIVKASHAQAIKSYNYLFGKPDVLFRDKQGRKIIIDGTKFKKAFFISVTVESLRAISLNLKIGNSLGLFQSDTFPWLVCLNDLRVVCEHMEGPAYLIDYLYRRNQFFKLKKFLVQDEVDLLGYYLKQDLRFSRKLIKEHDEVTIISLETLLPEFNRYYFYVQGLTTKEVRKLVHHTTLSVKTLIKTLEECKLKNGITAAVQLLEIGEHNRTQLIEYIKRTKKKYKKDGDNHDFRLAGSNDEGVSWMLSYWIGPESPGLISNFRQFVARINHEHRPNQYVAVFDAGMDGYDFKEIICLSN